MLFVWIGFSTFRNNLILMMSVCSQLFQLCTLVDQQVDQSKDSNPYLPVDKPVTWYETIEQVGNYKPADHLQLSRLTAMSLQILINLNVVRLNYVVVYRNKVNVQHNKF